MVDSLSARGWWVLGFQESRRFEVLALESDQRRLTRVSQCARHVAEIVERIAVDAGREIFECRTDSVFASVELRGDGDGRGLRSELARVEVGQDLDGAEPERVHDLVDFRSLGTGRDLGVSLLGFRQVLLPIGVLDVEEPLPVVVSLLLRIINVQCIFEY